MTGDYRPKGEYKAIGGAKKAYVVGDGESSKIIIVAYDAFGFAWQTQQGADILAETVGARVVMPDFFDGKPLDPKLFPPKTDEDRKKIEEWFATTGNFATRIDEFYAVAEALRAEGVTKIGALGYCWGGKMLILAGRKADKVDAIATAHPARMAVDDAKELAIPIGLFPSQNENEKECEEFMKILETKSFAHKNEYKYYPTVHHGWAAARADLESEENLKQYKDVYERLCAYFHKVLN